MYTCSEPTTSSQILAKFFFPISQTHESSCPTTLQFPSLLGSNGMTSDIPYANPGPSNRTFFWLSGAWPKFRSGLAKKISVLLALSAMVHRAQTKVSPEEVWKGDGTRFPHPRSVLMKFLEVRSLNLHTCTTPHSCLSFVTYATTSMHLCKGMKKVPP